MDDLTIGPGRAYQVGPRALSIEELSERCRLWQSILRLEDWDIEVQIARRHEMKSPSNVAQCTITTYRQARILVLHPIDFVDKDWACDRDMERNLVHELLHLPYDDCRIRECDADGRWTPEWVALERGIEMTAAALIKLRRDYERLYDGGGR